MRLDAKRKVHFLVVGLIMSLCFPALPSADADKIFKENSNAWALQTKCRFAMLWYRM